VQTTSSGVGQMIARLGLADRDVTVTTARGIHAIPLAEFVMMALLVHRRDYRHLKAEQAAHRWTRYCGTDLPGQVMAIVGAGKVGAEVGRLARAFGMRVLSVVRRADPGRAAELHADEVHGPEALAEVVARADCVVLCTPHTPETEGMISAGIIAGMKPGVTFVNIARGAVVDEPALIRALAQGHIGLAALDVAATEPLPADSPLWDMENVLISPHSASTVERENERLTDIFLHNLACWMRDDRAGMWNVLDKKRMY
jgi:phosphoglycerate dehydrogenase-like enzyme